MNTQTYSLAVKSNDIITCHVASGKFHNPFVTKRQWIGKTMSSCCYENNFYLVDSLKSLGDSKGP